MLKKGAQFLKKVWRSLFVGLPVSVLLTFGLWVKTSFIGQLLLPALWDIGMATVKLIVPTFLAPYASIILATSLLLPPAYTVAMAYLTDTLLDYPAARYKAPFYWTTHWILPCVSFLFAYPGLGFKMALGLSALLATTTSLAAELWIEGLDPQASKKKDNPAAVPPPNQASAALTAERIASPVPALLHDFSASGERERRQEAADNNELINLNNRSAPPRP